MNLVYNDEGNVFADEQNSILLMDDAFNRVSAVDLYDEATAEPVQYVFVYNQKGLAILAKLAKDNILPFPSELREKVPMTIIYKDGEEKCIMPISSYVYELTQIDNKIKDIANRTKKENKRNSNIFVVKKESE